MTGGTSSLGADRHNWLLLRGLVREQRHWANFRPTFEFQIPGAKTFALDLPGTGTEVKRAAPWGIDDTVQDLRIRWELLRAANPGPWSVLSISLGSMAALRWMELYPHDFQRGVVINTSAANLNPPHHRLGLRNLPALLKAARERDTKLREEMILRMTTRLAPELVPALATEWGRVARDAPVSPLTAVRQLAAALRFRAPAELAVPVLVLSSAGDSFTDPRCSQSLAQKLNAPLRVHPSAGHDVTIDDPEWVAAQVAAWLLI